MKTNTKQTVHKKTVTSYISLPEQLVEDVKSLELTKTAQSHAFKFIGILLRDSFDDYKDVTLPTPKPQSYLIKTFDSKYYKWLDLLIIKGIVMRSDYYSKESGVCYNYSISSSYFLQSSYALCKYKSREALLTVGYKDIIKNIKVVNGIHNRRFELDMLDLKIDYNRLNNIVSKRVKEITINEFKVNEQITELKVRIFVPNNKSFFMKTVDAIAKAKLEGKSLINDNGRYVIDNEESFIIKKKASIDLSYTDSIEKMRMGSFRAARNETNNRLDTNLTNMCSALVDDICMQNQLDQIDLNNSQFTILSHVLKDKLDTDDFRRFKALSVSGELYDYIKDNLGLQTRKQGKQAMFEIMFSSRKNNTTGKKKIKGLFPSVVKWIDDYKEENGDSSFAIMLQRKESEIFIDGILAKIKSKKYLCLTKHDSLIVRTQDREAILELVKAYFNEIGLEYNLDVKGSVSEDKVEMIAEVIEEEIVAVEAPIEVVEVVSIVEELLERINGYTFREKVHHRWMTEAITSGSINTHELFEQRIKLLNPRLK